MYENHTLLSFPEIKLMEMFLDLKKHYFAELVKVTKMTRPRTLRVLRKLVKQNVLEVRTEANIKYYSLQKSLGIYSLLSLVESNRALVFLEKHSMLNRALKMFKERYKDYAIMLIFGSAVKGYATRKSDLDLLIIKEDFTKSEIKKVENIIDLINGRTGLKISPYFMKVDEFRMRNELAKEVIGKHLIIDGGELFFRWLLE